MTERPLRLGTRGSALALAQAEQVAKALGGAEVVPIKTSDGRTRTSGGDKVRFVREIERALLDGQVDLGVHSAKDLPTDLPEGLEIAGVPNREDPRDAYIGRVSSLGEVPEGSRIGTSSLRRRAQILALRPDLEIVELRGNVDTRLRRYEEGKFEVVPGVTAGIAAPAYAGIPVTHRDDASAVAFVTGHEDPEKDSALDYDALARFPGTLVFYMGVRALSGIAEKLIESGRDPAELAAVVERGTLPGQRTIGAPLSDIARAAADAGIRPPSVTIVGPVAARREGVARLQRRPPHRGE